MWVIAAGRLKHIETISELAPAEIDHWNLDFADAPKYVWMQPGLLIKSSAMLTIHPASLLTHLGMVQNHTANGWLNIT